MYFIKNVDRMKILFVTKDDIGGIGQVCIGLMHALKALGHECHMLVLNKYTQNDDIERYGYWRWRLAKMPSGLLMRYGLKVTKRNKARSLGGGIPTSAVNLMHSRWVKWADVVHLHLVTNYIDFPSFFSKIGSKPIVWTLHDENFFYGLAYYEDHLQREHPLEQYYAELKRKALSQAKNQGIVMLSEYFEEKFKGHELLKGGDVRVITNAVDTTKYRPIPKAEARRRLGLSKDDTLIAFAATYMSEERKGLDKLSEVVRRIGNPQIKIIAAGKNIHHRSWPNVIEMGFKASTEDLCELFSAADFFALPSMQEAFALTPMQAMACGLPVVAFPVSGTLELINELNGVVCSDFTVEALHEGIMKLMSRSYDPTAIRQDMINRFSPTIIAQKYLELYESLLSGSIV
jgi:glycosyltransferase involved in cell wall biosynthesis